MVLTSAEIAQKEIVGNSVANGQRATTYDATVGCIIKDGCEISGNSHTLAPRGIVWVVSAETFKLPADVTGLATLRTTWTHDGILALNVGIVDPGWDGPLAAALVNFSNTNFVIKKGDNFLRLLFHGHDQCYPKIIKKTPDDYKKDIINKSRMFSDSFLSMDRLVSEVTEKVFSVPKFVIYLTLTGLALAAASIFAPMAYSVWSDNRNIAADLRSRVESVEKEIDDLRAQSSAAARLRNSEAHLSGSDRMGAPIQPSQPASPQQIRPVK
ncbi:dCTP deaminase domain-containing protein [Ancylobacter sp. G4_0304]|uniref:dCTP deaminase domain-containing protein n=1 Tax=Ancylobacter sp. G4_0304 TaxID=3114289 RepID=UPI0039C628ED